ncbi:putative phosphothreonine lyase domain-containg protein [Rhizobium sp. Kim5]|uniref:putative phosphothreonine lyase domain-containing protein n=1 Tax=Rhizobium sp. Kim5 TaxID=2020311 RepID=UPI000F744F8F|nr:putative phosphothreonine lyase domain-containg protein [Rhizobium sp. Kim5]
MLWHPTLSTSGFKSKILDSDEASSGKWLVPIPIPDVGLLWEEIEDAAMDGRLLAAKKSTHELIKIIGHNLACVYCAASDVDTVAETLQTLREIGVDGELRYKSDRATFDQRDEYLYSSSEFDLALKPV